MAKPTRRILVVSDLHVGSTVGLWPGRHRIEGGGTYEANKFQRWLYRCWRDLIDSVDDSPILVINGDIIQGLNHRDGQLISSNISDQTAAAQTLLQPLVAKCSRLLVIRGTEWHEGKASEDVELLAKSLGAEADPDAGQYTRWEL